MLEVIDSIDDVDSEGFPSKQKNDDDEIRRELHRVEIVKTKHQLRFSDLEQ